MAAGQGEAKRVHLQRRHQRICKRSGECQRPPPGLRAMGQTKVERSVFAHSVATSTVGKRERRLSTLA